MANRSKAEREVFITAAATLFVTYSRDAQEIADLLKSSKTSIHRYSKETRWAEVLQTLGYEGERNFRTQPARDSHRNAEFQTVQRAYLQAKRDGVPKRNIASNVAEQTGVKAWTVRDWARRFGWNG